MDEMTISKYRSEVIEKFINIEWIIHVIISQHYFKKVIISFLLEVLYDEYFSFALKRRILCKIVPDLDKSKIDDLNRLNTIRNYFAHCNQKVFESSEKPKTGETGKVIDPKNIKEEINFEKLHREFMKKEKSISSYLFNIYKDLGGEYEK